MECAFCTREEMRHRIIAENNLAFAFPTYTPVVEGHTIVCPKRHVRYYNELSTEERDAVEVMRMQIHEALKRALGAEGFNYAWNEEEVGGQSVPHFHLHILPRKQGDTGVYEYEPRQFLYAAKVKDDRQTLTDELLEETANIIRDHL